MPTRLDRPRPPGFSRRARHRLIFRVSAEEQAHVQEKHGFAIGTFCETQAEVLAALAEPGVSGLVWELSSKVPRLPEAIPAAIGVAAQRIPLLVRADYSSSNMREIVALASVAAQLRVSLCNFDDLADDLTGMIADPPETNAEQMIIKTVAPRLDALVRHIIVVAAIIGKRRTHVTDVAHLTGLNERTLEWRFRAVGGPTPTKVLGWMVALHTMWRLEVLGWSVKRAADAAHFRDAAALSNYMYGHFGARPRRALELGGSSYWLGRFIALWNSAKSSETSRAG